MHEGVTVMNVNVSVRPYFMFTQWYIYEEQFRMLWTTDSMLGMFEPKYLNKMLEMNNE